MKGDTRLHFILSFKKINKTILTLEKVSKKHNIKYANRLSKFRIFKFIQKYFTVMKQAKIEYGTINKYQ